jgi:hypothetical protein
MADIGCSQDEAETEICRAIADGAINFQGELKLHATRRFTARGTVLDGEAFQLPKVIGRGDLDWENSSLSLSEIKSEHSNDAIRRG